MDRRIPPPDAHSRVTDPERFRPLHRAGLELVADLRAVYEADMLEETNDLADAFREIGLDRPSLRIDPREAGASPLTIVFTAFPGVAIGFGLGSSEVFPRCGCDACGETLEEELARLESLIEDVTAGRFLEELESTDPLRCRWDLWSDSGRRRGTSVLTRRVEPRLRGGRRERIQWRPWGRRPDGKALGG